MRVTTAGSGTYLPGAVAMEGVCDERAEVWPPRSVGVCTIEGQRDVGFAVALYMSHRTVLHVPSLGNCFSAA